MLGLTARVGPGAPSLPPSAGRGVLRRQEQGSHPPSSVLRDLLSLRGLYCGRPPPGGGAHTAPGLASDFVVRLV